MSTQKTASRAPEHAANMPSLDLPHEVPLGQGQLTELQEAWLEHQVTPSGKIQSRGVPFSALND
jgi:hypothetical protein